MYSNVTILATYTLSFLNDLQISFKGYGSNLGTEQVLRRTAQFSNPTAHQGRKYVYNRHFKTGLTSVCCVVPGPPSNFEVIARGATHFELQWEKTLEPNGNVIGYNISYQTSKNTREP